MNGKKWCVYKHYSADGTLLYVGASANPLKRMECHKSKSWATEVATMTLTWFDTKSEQSFAERTAIFEGRPKYNIKVASEQPKLAWRWHDKPEAVTT